MTRKRKWLFGLILVLALVGLIAKRVIEPSGQSDGSMKGDPWRVTWVVDGDTIRATRRGRNETVRLLRIDTPERGQRGHREATRALIGLVKGQDVTLVLERPGLPERDVHGRLLAYVFLDEANVNVEMVRLGWSRFWTAFGAGRLAEAFEKAEAEARQAKRGLWRR